MSRLHRQQPQPVSPLELFFDLVFVFGVAQLSHHLLEHLTWRGFTETVVLLLAIFTVWAYTSWETTFTTLSRSAARTKVLLSMPLILFMNASIGGAFAEAGWAFAVPYLLVQLGRTFWTRQMFADGLFHDHFNRTLGWIAATTPLWLAGAFAEPYARLWCWLAAALIDLTGTLLAHPVPGRHFESVNVGFDGEHMLERGRLLFIIALGETVLTTGSALANAPKNALTALMGGAALLTTIALWAMSFGGTDRVVTQHLEETRDPIRAAMLTINTLPAMVLGLILLAVASELAIAHPYVMGFHPLSVLLFGGPLLVLATQSFYHWRVSANWPRLRLLAMGVLLLTGLVTLNAPPIVSLLLATAVISAFAILDKWMGDRF